MAHSSFPPMKTPCEGETLRTAICENSSQQVSTIVPNSTLKMLLPKVDRMSAYFDKAPQSVPEEGRYCSIGPPYFFRVF